MIFITKISLTASDGFRNYQRAGGFGRYSSPHWRYEAKWPVLLVTTTVIIIRMTIFMVLSSWLTATARVYPVHLMKSDGCQPSDQAKQLGLWVRRYLLPSTFTIVILLLLSWKADTHFTVPRRVRGCQPRHCSNGAQPVPKAVYRSGSRDKHNRPRWDSKLGPRTPQSGALSNRPLRPAAFNAHNVRRHSHDTIVSSLDTKL